MKTLKTACFTLICIVALAGCKKETVAPEATPDPVSYTKTQLLCNKQWRLTELTKTVTTGINDEQQTISIYAHVRDCYKDNTYQFKEDGRAILNGNDEKCNNGEVDYLEGNWNWFSNETSVATDFNIHPSSEIGENIQIKNVQINSTTLTGSTTQQDGSVFNYTFTAQ